MTGGYDPTLFARLAAVEDNSFWFRSRNRLIVSFVSRWSTPGQSVLEVGCGTGYVLAALIEECGLQATGAELMSEGLDEARKRIPDANLVELDALHMPFEQEFDVVGAFDVLEHIDDDVGALRGLYKAVRVGGYLVVTVPQHRWLWGPSDDQAKHVRRYRRGDLLARIREVGFTPVRSTSFVSLLVPFMLVSRWLERRATNANTMSDLAPGGPLNRIFEVVLTLERAIIKMGANLPIGGSLIVVAKRS